jgi:Domain of unknown function (DUF4430)
MRHPFALVATILVVLLLQSCTQPAATPKPPIVADSTAQVQMTSLVVHLPDSLPSKVWEVEVGAELTVRELMVALRDAQFMFTDTLYPGMGHLVTGIAGIKNPGANDEYWQFCIDNVASDRGVDERKVAPGHQVDWHYSKYGELPCKKIGE